MNAIVASNEPFDGMKETIVESLELGILSWQFIRIIFFNIPNLFTEHENVFSVAFVTIPSILKSMKLIKNLKITNIYKIYNC